MHFSSGVGSHLIEEDERADHLAFGVRQGAVHGKTAAQIAVPVRNQIRTSYGVIRRELVSGECARRPEQPADRRFLIQR